MATVLRMPELAANTPEATLVEWLVTEGAKIAAGDPIATVETAKATVDVEAEAGGIVLRLVASAGTDIQVGAAIAVVGEEGEWVSDADVDGADGESDREQVDQQPVPPASVPAAPPAPPAPAARQEPVRDAEPARVFASPLARKLTRDAGLDLAELVGTGPGGRIVRRDVTAALARNGARAERATTSVPAPSVEVVGSQESLRNSRDIPHTRLRRAIATRLTESKQQAPHFYVRGTARVDELLALREQLNQRATARISVNDLVVMAVAKAHRTVPGMNVVWSADAVRQFDGVDVAVAVATPDGLLTPVVRSVDTMNLSTLAASTRDFAERAREGRIRPDELDGGSITVTNLGMYGTEEFTAIINPPHASILAVGAALETVVVDDGRCAVARTVRLTLSVDHRPVDGVVAAQWMQELVALLEEPLRIVT
jgi:pyruvate dehydrogenase E2 component (dihydrolipoamide acetyltransferase)